MFITIKDFLRNHPDAELDLMTTRGMILLQPWQVRKLLEKDGSKTRLRVCGTKEVVIASAILDHIVCKIVRYKNNYRHFFLLTHSAEELAKKGIQPHIEYEQTRLF